MSTSKPYRILRELEVGEDNLAHHRTRKLLTCRFFHFCVLYTTVITLSTIFLAISVIHHPSCIQKPSHGDPGSTCTSRGQHTTKGHAAVDWLDTICFPCTELSSNVTWNEKDTLFTINASCTPKLCCLKEVGNLRKLFYLILNAHYRSLDKDHGDIFQGENKVNAEHIRTNHNNDTIPVAAVAGGDNGKNQEESTTSHGLVHSLGFWEKRVEAAHLFIDSSQLSTSESGSIPWVVSNPLQTAMISTKMHYNASTRLLKIKDYGMYFVYSAITFREDGFKRNSTVPVYHTVSRRHHLLPKSGEELLMINKYGGGQQSRGLYNSFLCGSLWLRSDDELSIKVSNHTHIYNYFYSNYFGIYKL